MSKSLPVVQPGRAGQTPIFEKIGIVGLGLMGGSLALAAREVWPSSLVVGVDEKDVLERGMVRGAIDVGADDLVVIAEADLVVLAAPVAENVRLLHMLDEYVPGEAVVTDLGGTKREMVAAARALPTRFTFVGGHPLAGAARSGIDAARSDLFKGRPWLFTPSGTVHGGAIERLFAFASGVGSVPKLLDPDVHDRLVAFLSHLPQLSASALMRVVGDAVGEEGLQLSGRGLADTTRLASSPARIWRDICATNADHIGEALDLLIADLKALRADLTTGDALERIFESATDWKAKIP
ncbi:MAG TPA: prephenate dehydrogenase/arogenate dehydrogenase family protein [Vicinamibacterales bacterium]|jgi:prephenate dehydrogenase|nr:prephenate dehydrogenase/arogenate dehydrogenase family protein [Vicinamibacterales bacterium]